MSVVAGRRRGAAAVVASSRYERHLAPLCAQRSRWRVFSSLATDRPQPVADLAEFAARRQTGVNMQALLSTGMGLRLEKSNIDASLPTQQRTLIQIAQFLRHELPIRLAHRATELEELPHGLSEMPSVMTVRDWYVESFNDLLAQDPPRTPEQEAAFEQVLSKIYDRHAPTLLKMARGVHEFKQELRKRQPDLEVRRRTQIWEYPEVHHFLDAFYVSRIGIRILIGQYLELHHPQEVSAAAGRGAARGRARRRPHSRARAAPRAARRAGRVRRADQHADLARGDRLPGDRGRAVHVRPAVR